LRIWDQKIISEYGVPLVGGGGDVYKKKKGGVVNGGPLRQGGS